MVDLLLEWRPALAGEVDSGGSSPLHFAASDSDWKIVEAILRAAPAGTVYMQDSGGLSALHVAARMGHHRVVDDLLGSFPDAAELRDGDGGTFVHTAAREKRSKVVSLAVKNTMLRGLLDAQDRDGNTPLHLAVAVGAPGVVEALLRKGKVRADVLNNDGRTAFDLATGSTSFFTMVRTSCMYLFNSFLWDLPLQH
jgi:ankyrin repeat protein